MEQKSGIEICINNCVSMVSKGLGMGAYVECGHQPVRLTRLSIEPLNLSKQSELMSKILRLFKVINI